MDSKPEIEEKDLHEYNMSIVVVTRTARGGHPRLRPPEAIGQFAVDPPPYE